MAKPIRTPLTAILTAVKTRLTEGDLKAVDIAAQCWQIRSRKELPASFMVDPVLMLLASNLKALPASAEGGGRVTSWKVRHLTVYIVTRDDADPSHEDTHRLTHETTGHYTLEEKVDDALQLFDGDTTPTQIGDTLLVQGMKQVGGTDAREYSQNKSYTVSTLVYEMIYQPNLTQSYQ
jgi:hypothetical protein